MVVEICNTKAQEEQLKTSYCEPNFFYPVFHLMMLMMMCSITQLNFFLKFTLYTIDVHGMPKIWQIR